MQRTLLGAFWDDIYAPENLWGHRPMPALKYATVGQ